LRQIKERFSLKEEVGKSQLAQAKHLLDTYVVLPVVEPVTNEVSRRVNKVRKKVRRSLRQIVEVATIRTRKLYLKFNGHFDEVQRELKYEIYRQYVDHHVAEAKEKAKHEFAVIESGEPAIFPMRCTRSHTSPLQQCILFLCSQDKYGRNGQRCKCSNRKITVL